jgi:beta-glucosidase
VCGYNLPNGTYSCENSASLGLLKSGMNFSGWVVSDWGADHGSVRSLNAGMDQTMGGGFNAATTAAILGGQVGQERLDDANRRILTPLFRVGVFDRSDYGNTSARVDSAAHAALAQRLAEQSAVLLRNEDAILPLSAASLHANGRRIAVVGDATNTRGGGSGAVWAAHITTPTEAIIARLQRQEGRTTTTAAAAAAVAAASRDTPGGGSCDVCSCKSGMDYNGNDIRFVKVSDAAACCAACRAEPACNVWSYNGPNNNQCWLKTSAAGGSTPISSVTSGTIPARAPTPAPPPFACSVPLGAAAGSGAVVCNRSVPFSTLGMSQFNQSQCTTQPSDADIAAAVALAKTADVAIVNVAQSSTEGYDRDTLSLGARQDRLVEQVAAACPNTIVVVRCPGAVLMPWKDKVKAIIVQFLPGQASGTALASLLFGDANPGAKLPVSFPAAENQTWLSSAAMWPGAPQPGTSEPRFVATYSEELEMGYRWFDARGEVPLWEFGAGLSYTTFGFSGLAAAATGVSCTVTNTGALHGAEVAQLYIGFPDASGEPPKLLRGFEKVALEPGASVVARFNLTDRDLSIFDAVSRGWVKQHGEFRVYVGSSSRKLPLVGSFVVA